MMKDLLSKLKAERVDGRCVRNNFSDHDQWVNVENIEDILKQEEIELNQNQEIVLEWMKDKVGNTKPFHFIGIVSGVSVNAIPIEILRTLMNFNCKEQFQLLAEFAKWGLGEVE